MLKKELVYKQISIDDIMQSNMQQPTKASVYHGKIMEDFTKKNLAVFFRKWELKLLMDKVITMIVR